MFFDLSLIIIAFLFAKLSWSKNSEGMLYSHQAIAVARGVGGGRGLAPSPPPIEMLTMIKISQKD